MPKTLTIEGETYEIVSERRNQTAVYRGGVHYARVGSRDALKKDIELHRKMESLRFPVASFVSEGEVDGMCYFTETSLGTLRMRDIFAQDVQHEGSISNEHFDEFLSICLKFSEAQMKTVVPADLNGFASGIHLEVLCTEMPDFRERIQRKFEHSMELLRNYPFVLSHGDFNPSNLYPSGVIDFEDSFHGPLGYDMITAIVTADWFPEDEGYEYRRNYSFSDEQKQSFLRALDKQYSDFGYQPLSDAYDLLAFCRAMWHVVRMQSTPKIQKWRHDRFVDLYLKNE